MRTSVNQYCRYCLNLVTGNGTYCQAKQESIKDSYAKQRNFCKLFEFCEIDAFGETAGYKPRERKTTPDGQQEALFKEWIK